MTDCKCPVCDTGNVALHKYTRSVEHLGVKGEIAQEARVCDFCGMQTYEEAELKYNRRALVAFKSTVDGTPSFAEIRSARLTAGVTSQRAGELFGAGSKAFSKWEHADIGLSGPSQRLAMMSILYPDTYARLVHTEELISSRRDAAARIASESTTYKWCESESSNVTMLNGHIDNWLLIKVEFPKDARDPEIYRTTATASSVASEFFSTHISVNCSKAKEAPIIRRSSPAVSFNNPIVIHA